MCIPECCADEVVHRDAYVERNRRNEFIQSQFAHRLGLLNEKVPSLIIAPRPLREAVEDEHGITDDERMVISYRVFGFIMRSRKWGEWA